MNYTLLATEINTDPQTLGYAPFVANGSDQSIADMLNAPTATTGWRNDVTPQEVLERIVGADFVLLPVGQQILAQLLFAQVGNRIDASKASIQNLFVAAFGTGTATTTALIAMAQKYYSRAEVLFGVGTHVSAYDIAKARTA